MFLLGLGIGIVVGVVIGYFVCALCVISKETDKRTENLFKNKNNENENI